MSKVHLLLSAQLCYLALQEVGSNVFISLFDRDNAFQHRYKLAADVMCTEFTAIANSHRQSQCLAFPQRSSTIKKITIMVHTTPYS